MVNDGTTEEVGMDTRLYDTCKEYVKLSNEMQTVSLEIHADELTSILEFAEGL